MFINSIIVLSVISLVALIVMIAFSLLKRTNKGNLKNYHDIPDMIDNNFSHELYGEKIIDPRLVESNYELMTTEIEDGDEKEICIRDF